MKLSVVIPALNEERVILRALSSASEADEVLVIDGGSDDSTVRIAREHGVRVLRCLPGRGRQLARGAELAAGDALLFLHADTVLPQGFRREVIELLETGGAVWGRFDVRFDGGGILLQAIARLISARSRITHVATGDQAIFVLRGIFEQVGGFRETLLFEDVDLCRRLKRAGPMGIPQRFVVTSARRWRARGTLRTSMLMWALKALYLSGVPAGTLRRFYPDQR